MDMMVDSVNDPTLTSSKIISSKIWILIGVFLFIIAFITVSHRVYQAQPAEIVIDPNGLNTTEYQKLSKAVSQHDVGNFFMATLPRLQDIVMTQSWVSQVNIERQWGRGIVISALPRIPIARFGSEHLIDAEGVVFKPAAETDLTQSDLIMLQGNEEQSTLIMQQMQLINKWFAPLNMKVEDMVLTPRMTWVVKFDNGMRVIVDNEHTSQKLMNLSQLLQNQLKMKRDEIASVDLRYKNGFVIAWKDEQVAPIELISLSEIRESNEERDIAHQ